MIQLSTEYSQVHILYSIQVMFIILLIIFYIFKHLHHYFIFIVCFNEPLLYHHSDFCEIEIGDYKY